MPTAIFRDVTERLTAQRVFEHSYYTEGDFDLENWNIDFISRDF
jgi:hypothetical protein